MQVSQSCEAALQHLLPGRSDTLLLSACLLDGADAAHAWSEFAAAVADPKRYFEADQTGLKGLLPFLGSRLMANDIDPGREFQTYARVAFVREELRSRIYQDILTSVLDAFDAARIEMLLLKGAAVSATVYPQPSARHNHAIDLLVERAQLGAAREVIERLRFAAAPPGPGFADHRDYRHWTGLALGLHARALFLPHLEMAPEELWGNARTVRAGGVAARVMSPEHALVHVLAHACYARSRANLRWVCDAYYLVQRNAALDWDAVARAATVARATLPALVMLRWLRESFGLPIPERATKALGAASAELDRIAVEGIFASLLHTQQSWTRALACFGGDRRTMWRFVRFSVLPSPRYVRWRYNVRSDWTLPLYYVRRPLRFAIGAMRRRFRGERTGDAARSVADEGVVGR